jgi:hypothetical protein
MRIASRFLCVALLVSLGVSVSSGWGNMTHVYFAKHFGVKVGVLNLNEMYGALLTDMVNFDFTPAGQELSKAFHYNTDLTWGFYGATTTAAGKAAFYGMFTHNNAWGVDYTAHDNGMTVGNVGWVPHYAERLEQPIAAYLTTLFVAKTGYPAEAFAELSAGLAHTMAHDVIEQSVDVLIKRYNDPLVGARLVLAASNRTEEVPQAIAAVIGGIYGPEAGEQLRKGEGEYREAMKQYGQLFMLPEQQMIPAMCGVSAGIAHDFIKAITAQMAPELFPEGADLAIDPAVVEGFLRKGIAIVRPVYNAELLATIFLVERNLRVNGVMPAGPIFAFFGKGGIEEELMSEPAGGKTPADFALGQNFPNPFNPATRISFAIPLDGMVTLTVYNALGQEVSTLVNEQRPAGRYDVTWDASGLPSGVYFARLQAGNLIETRKMTLVK